MCIKIETIEHTEAGDCVLSTTKTHTITASFIRPLSGRHEVASLSLLYFPSKEIVPDSYAGKQPLEGIVPFPVENAHITDKQATFKVKIHSLSSQHSHTKFCFRVTSGDTSFVSDPFKTVSKAGRKRKHGEIALSETALSETAFSETAFSRQDSETGSSFEDRVALTDWEWVLQSDEFDHLVQQTAHQQGAPSAPPLCCHEAHEKLDAVLSRLAAVETLLQTRLSSGACDRVGLCADDGLYESGTDEVV